MLVQGEIGRNNAGRRAARASSSSSKSSCSRSSTPPSTGKVRTRVAECMQAKAPAQRAHVVGTGSRRLPAFPESPSGAAMPACPKIFQTLVPYIAGLLVVTLYYKGNCDYRAQGDTGCINSQVLDHVEQYQ